MRYLKYFLLLFFATLFAVSYARPIAVGAERITHYTGLLKQKRVGLLVNQTSMVGGVHLLDTLLSLGVDVRCVFSPEHGFRGDADAGAEVDNSVDSRTNIPVVSLYGASKKPSPQSMAELDVIVFDLQDVGVRFYTYLSTLHYLLEAAAENEKDVVILDRPNPNGHYVDGPVLDLKYRSFVGIYPVPVVHGMTLGELAMMARGEGWCKVSPKSSVTIIPCANYKRYMSYSLPIAPSPNLKTMQAIYLYPSLCFFEATNVSVGRGTSFPFMAFGHPQMKSYSFRFTPTAVPGAANPPQKGVVCYGRYLGDLSLDSLRSHELSLDYLVEAYQAVGKQQESSFFSSFFERLIGVDYPRKMIVAGASADEVRQRWRKDVEQFKITRKPYLLYD